MKVLFALLALLAAGCGGSLVAPGPAKPLPINSPSTSSASTKSAPNNRILLIDPSSMPIAAGKATLIIGALQRTNGVYSGDYKIKVAPYFFKSEKGRLAIIVSDQSLAAINKGKVAAIIGTSTTSGKDGKTRHIDATATPANIDHGKLKLWFMAGDRKMVFEPAYHFAGPGTAETIRTNLASER